MKPSQSLVADRGLHARGCGRRLTSTLNAGYAGHRNKPIHPAVENANAPFNRPAITVQSVSDDF
jgi:hypothetical protein